MEALTLLNDYGVPVKDQSRDEVAQLIDEHLETLVYNVTATSVVMALLKDSIVIKPEHLVEVRNYISTSCGQKGGAAIASDYFGVTNPIYTENGGQQHDNVVQFSQGIARAAVGGGAAKKKAAKDPLVGKIQDVLDYHGATATKAGMTELVRIMRIHIQCLLDDLVPLAPLTKSKVAQVLKLKRHAVFH